MDISGARKNGKTRKVAFPLFPLEVEKLDAIANVVEEDEWQINEAIVKAAEGSFSLQQRPAEKSMGHHLLLMPRQNKTLASRPLLIHAPWLALEACFKFQM